MSTFETLKTIAMGLGNYEPMLVSVAFADNYLKGLLTPENLNKDFRNTIETLSAAYGQQLYRSEKPFAFSEGIAVIPITGMLVNRFSGSYGWVTGYQGIRNQLNYANQDPEVRGVIFDVNSGGGDAAGMFELAEEIKNFSKPTLSVVDSHAYSAAYGLGSAADKMVMSKSGGVGSIGVLCMHFDYSKMLEKMGVSASIMFAGKHKVDGNPYQSLSKIARERIQSRVEKLYDDFVELTATNRNLEQSSIRNTEAATFDADEALRIGLVDAIQAPKDAFAAFQSALSGAKKPKEGIAMSTPQTEPGAAAATQVAAPDQAAIRSEGANAERQRVGAILNCEEAKGREKLANHIAFNTTMDLASAKAMLSASAVQAAAPAQSQTTPFHAAMASGNPELTATGTQSADNNTSADQVNTLLKDYAAVTGNKVIGLK